MPTITDDMSEDGKSVEQRFIDILYNGGSAGELSGALGNLLRKMQHCDNLVQFIVGNGHGPAYVQRFNNCVGGGSQDIRDFLRNLSAELRDELMFKQPESGRLGDHLMFTAVA